MSEEQLFTTYQVVYESLKEKIIQGKFEPGEKLPSFSELCEIYNVSNITVRKSIELLRQNGYVYSKPRIGNFVSPAKNETYELIYNQKVSLKHKPTAVRIVSVQTVDLKEMQQYTSILPLRQAKCFKVERMHYFGELPVMYEMIFVLHHPKLNIQNYDAQQVACDGISVLNNYDINKQLYISVDNHCDYAKDQLFLGEEDSVFRILIEYCTKGNRFAGISVAFVSCEDIRFKIS